MTTEPEPPPEAACFRLATAYLARRAASKLQLRRYLVRKLSGAGADGRTPEGVYRVVEAVLARLERLQLIDETSLALSRAGNLKRKGFSGRRLRAHLAHQGFDLADPAIAPSLDVADDAQAARYAQRKRLGPYATDPRRSSFDRDVRTLVRAGFAADVAVRVMRTLRAAMPDAGSDDLPDVNAP